VPRGPSCTATSHFFRIAFIAALAASPSAARSDQHQVYKAAVLERGVYQAGSEAYAIAQSSVGPVTKVRNATLVQSTTKIPARRFIRFGLRYVITGFPRGAQVGIKVVTRFPEPGLQDPRTGFRHNHSEYVIPAQIGAQAYREFMFDHSWEMLPGAWVFEFWHKCKLIGSQTFCVFEEHQADLPHEFERSHECAPAVG
jgi:hypothetical protein